MKTQLKIGSCDVTITNRYNDYSAVSEVTEITGRLVSRVSPVSSAESGDYVLRFRSKIDAIKALGDLVVNGDEIQKQSSLLERKYWVERYGKLESK